MVWPILISVAVTPRISAAVAGSASNTSAPNPASKRIVSPPMCGRLADSRDRRGSADALSCGATCHGVPNHAMANDDIRGIKKTRRRRRVFWFRCNPLSRLRLRLQAGIRIGTRARLASGRHRGSARRARLQHRLAVGLLALQQVDDLIAAQRLEFEQALGQRLEVVALAKGL